MNSAKVPDALLRFIRKVLENQSYNSQEHITVYTACCQFCRQASANSAKLFLTIHNECILLLKRYYTVSSFSPRVVSIPSAADHRLTRRRRSATSRRTTRGRR